jgi:hypothetical protein
MPARIQSYKIALGSAKQANVTTASTTYNCFTKLDTAIPTLRYNTETNKDEIGKGHEFITDVYPTHYDIAYAMQKYGSSEWVLWSWAYALGNVGLSAGLYTIKPIDPATTLELPYFSMVSQLPEGGGDAVDELYYGMAVESVELRFKYGPGRQSLSNNVNIVGTGKNLRPSVVVIPAPLTEKYMLSSSMAISINGIDYVAGSPGAKTVLMGTIGWANNLILPLRYFPGSGTQDSAAIGGRTFIGNRAPTLTFTVFLQADSTELTKLIAQTTGTATITFTFDATHFVTFTYTLVSFEMVDRVVEEGLVAVQVTCAPKYDPSGTPDVGVVVVTGKCAITDIAQ